MDSEPLTPQPPQPQSRRRKLGRWKWGFVGLVVVVGGAVGAFRWFAPRDFKMIVDAQPPTDVRVFDDLSHGPRYSDSELNEFEFTQTLQSMFVAEPERRVDAPAAGAKRRYRFEFSRRGIGRMSGVAAADVYETDQGFVWTEGGDYYRPWGNVAELLTARPACRAVYSAQMSRGAAGGDDALLKLGIETVVDMFLALLRSENPHMQQLALNRLQQLAHSRDAQRWATSDGEIVRDLRPSPLPGVERIRTALLDVLRQSQNIPRSEEKRRSVRFHAASTLESFVDHSIAGDVAELLAAAGDYGDIDSLMRLLTAAYGLPEFFEPLGFCGHTTAAEIAQAQAEIMPERLKARTELLAWHAAHGNKPRTEQLFAVLEAWSTRLQKFGNGEMREFPFGHGIRLETRYLLRLGPDLAPEIEARQRATSDLAERGALEYLRACLLGDCNKALVDELLAGDLRNQRFACRIIGVSGRRDWTDRLDALQRLHAADAKPGLSDDTAHLVEAASQALWMTLRSEALPIFTKAQADGYSNRQLNEFVRMIEVAKRPRS